MVKFQEPKLISGVITQGSPDSPRWVEKFNIYYSTNGKDFVPYTEYPGDSTPYTFTANKDGTTPVRNLLNRNIIAQYVKIVPVQAAPGGIGLRLDMLGCQPENVQTLYLIPTPLVPGSTMSPSTGPTLHPPIVLSEFHFYLCLSPLLFCLMIM